MSTPLIEFSQSSAFDYLEQRYQDEIIKALTVSGHILNLPEGLLLWILQQGDNNCPQPEDRFLRPEFRSSDVDLFPIDDDALPKNHIRCPHCQELICVEDPACTIFRHGHISYIDPLTGKRIPGAQMNPHAPKEECDRLAKEGKIFGCGKPFRYDGMLPPTICDYV